MNVTFIPSNKFVGSKPGFVFRSGEKGLGYYFDTYYSFESKTNDKKRKIEEVELETKAPELASKPVAAPKAEILVEKKQMSIDQLLEQADQVDIAPLDATGLKQLILNLEKKITKNQKMRMKYPDEPEKFMDSEIELNQEIEELHVIAASPELYPILLHVNGLASIIGLIPHENTDISIATIGLLQELTDSDNLLQFLDSEENEENEEQSKQQIIQSFLQSLIKLQGLEVLVENLFRLHDEEDDNSNGLGASEEDIQGVYNTLQIFENVLDLKPEISTHLMKNTNLPVYLLNKLITRKFTTNKLYSSEILSMLLQNNTDNQIHLGQLYQQNPPNINAIETLLQAISYYKKKEVVVAEEQEYVENLFLCLSSTLMISKNQLQFLEFEGFELLLRCLSEKQYASSCTLHSLKYALMKNKDCCEKFVDLGGLKYIFSIFLLLVDLIYHQDQSSSSKQSNHKKKFLTKKLNNQELQQYEESVISIIAQLCLQLFDTNISIEENVQSNNLFRLLQKFLEKNYEKYFQTCQLYVVYANKLEAKNQELETIRERIIRARDREALEEFDDPDNIYLQRLDGGLFVVQQLALILSFVLLFDNQVIQPVKEYFDENNLSIDHIVDVLNDMILNISDSDPNSTSESIGQGIDITYRNLLSQWSFNVNLLINSSLEQSS